MAGIYSKGGSAGHRYAGELSKVEAKNFAQGGKVFNGSPSAIYVGSKRVWSLSMLSAESQSAIITAFYPNGEAVLKATNTYLKQMSDQTKAQQYADIANANPSVSAVGLGRFCYYFQQVEYIEATGTQGMQLQKGATLNSIINYTIEYTAFRNGDRDWFIGNRQAQTNWLAGYYNGKSCLWCGSGYNYAGSLSTNEKITQTIDFTTYTFKDEKASTSIQTITPSSGGIMLFLGNGSTLGNGTKNKFYYLDIIEQGSTVLMLFPCYRKSDSVIGAFDWINDVFYTNLGSGTFVIPTPSNP